MIVVLSDLHLGLRGAPEPAALAPLFDGAQELILNGDASESGTATLRAPSLEALARLEEVARAQGARVTHLAGNHDPLAGELLAHRCEDAVVLTHGHAFHPMIAPWSPHADEVGAVFRRAHEAAPALAEPQRTLAAAQAAALHERERDAAKHPLEELLWTGSRPWKMLEVIGYWRIYPELGARFLEQCAAGAPASTKRILICGHSHRAGAWALRGGLMLNTGSFTFPGTPHAVLLEGDEAVLVPLQRRRGEWRYLAQVRRSWSIGALARATAPASTPVS